ncbi:MAG: hypothetical protein LBC04_00440 [Holosporaceae bacterium]|jgi:hypothetical protein|nr:hypothetical protein [Holosporaceae bacterium]
MRQLITLLFSKKYSDEDFKCTDVFRKLTIISMVLSLSLLFTDEKSYAMFIPQMQIAPNLFEKKSPPPKTANMPRLQKSDDEIEEPPKPTDEQPGTGKEGVTLLGGNTTRNRSKSLAPIMLSVPIDQSIFNTESSSLSEVTAKDGKKSVVKSRKSIVEFDLPTAPNIFESRSLPLKTANMPRLQKSDDEIEEPPELTDGQSGMGKGGVTLWGGNTTRNRSESLAPIILSVPIDQSIFNTGSSSLSEVTAKDREKSVVKSRKSIVKFDLPMASDIFRGELPLFKIAVKRTKSINKSRGSVVEFDLPVASDIFGDGPPPYKIATKRTKSVGKSRESVVEFDLPMDSNHILGISSEEEENSEDESKEDADDNEAEEDTEDKEDETDNGEEDVGDEAKDDSGEEADSAEEEEDEETEKAKKSKKSKKKKSKKERDDEDEDDDEETEKAKKSKKSKKKKLKEERDDDEDDDDEEEGEEASPEKKKNKKSKTLESEEEDADDENSGDDEDSEIVSEGRKSRIVGSVTNYDDREVVRETVDYLMALGVIDESKLDGLAFGDTMHGVCMLCGRLRSVHVIGGQLEYGICTPCMKRRVRQLEEGSLIGGASPMTQMVNALSGRDGGDYDGDNHEYGSRGNYGDDYDGSDYGGRNGRGSGLSGILGNGVGNMLQKLASGAEGGNGAQMAPGVGAAAGAAGAGQMVLNASGQLVPLSMVSAAAPYGYVRDPSTGQMRPATSLAEGTSAAQAAAAAGAQMAPGAQGVAAMSQVANLAGALGQNGVGNSINSVANTVAQNSALINSAASGLGSLLSSIKKPSSTAVAGSGTSSATGTNTTTGAGTSTAGGNTAASSGSASSATGANAATGTLDLSKLPKDKRENIEKLRKLWSNLTDKLTAAKNSSDSALSKLNTAQNELKEEEEEAQKATGNQKKKAENKVKKLKKSVDSAQKQYDKQTKAYNTAKVAADTAKASLDAAEQAAASS